MFSYRHAYHAGNHADVLKHLVQIASLDYLLLKDNALSYIETHAGTGLYALHDERTRTSGEAARGISLLLAKAQVHAESQSLPVVLDRYIKCVTAVSSATYPGSPFFAGNLLRKQDTLYAFELLAADARQLRRNIQNHPLQATHKVYAEDGFAALKKLLPPPSRRGFVLIDPSYEIKTDYEKVSACVQDAMLRFATGVYMVWYPIIPRPQAHQLPRKLKTLARQAGKNWLHATLSIKGVYPEEAGYSKLLASGVLVINPPHLLAPQLRQALPLVAKWLGGSKSAQWTLETS